MDKSTIKRKLTGVTLSQKHSIVLDIENGKRQAQVCRETGLPQSTVSDIWKKREKILVDSTNFSPSVKKNRPSMYPLTDSALLKWFNVQRNRNIPLSGPILVEKAKELSENLGEVFTGSNGWLEGWKKRHAISLSPISGEAGSVDDQVVSTWLTNVWPKLRQGYADDDIYNADEFGLFFKLLPNKTLHRKGSVCTGGKLSKERITVLVGSNSTGSDKLKPLVIGKYENPRPFKNVKKSSLPVDYRWNSTAWMTKELFREWITELNLRMKREKRKILMIVDNCRPHEIKIKLSNVKLAFFPPNVTSRLQPMDQGIINETKKLYRGSLVRKLIDLMDQELAPKIDILDGILNLSSAWNNVPQKTIRNCFYHSKIIERPTMETEIPSIQVEQMHSIPEEFCGTSFDFEEYIYIDNLLATYDESDADILASASEREVEEQDREELEGEDDPEIERVNVTTNQALDHLHGLRMYLLAHDHDNNLLKPLDDIENLIVTNKFNSGRQSEITDFFPVRR